MFLRIISYPAQLDLFYISLSCFEHHRQQSPTPCSASGRGRPASPSRRSSTDAHQPCPPSYPTGSGAGTQANSLSTRRCPGWRRAGVATNNLLHQGSVEVDSGVTPIIHRIKHMEEVARDDVAQTTRFRHPRKRNFAGIPQLADLSICRNLIFRELVAATQEFRCLLVNPFSLCDLSGPVYQLRFFTFAFQLTRWLW